MPTVIRISEDYGVEKSHLGIEVAFTDENDAEVIPDSITWTLTNEAGDTVINERENVAVSSPAATITITLYGDDLQIDSGFTGEFQNRKLTISAVVDTDIGDNLPLIDSLTFPVKNLAAVS